MITSEMVEAIESRAAMLSNKFYFLDKEDLVQDGVALLLKLEQGKARKTKEVFKTINNFFSDVQDKAVIRNNRERNFSSFEVTPEETFEDTPEEELHKKQVTEKLMTSIGARDKIVLIMLFDGLTLEEIAKCMCISIGSVRRIASKIIKIRKELDNAD